MEDRAAALEELCGREADDLDQLLLDEWARTEAEPRWRNLLVLVAERVRVRDPSRRARLADHLLREALRLRDASEADADPPLWAAVRRFGSLASIDRVHELHAFLRPQDSGTTRQVAFQAIHSMLEFETTPTTLEAAALVTRIAELAAKYLDVDRLTSPENVALAVSCFCAAVLAGAPEAMALTERLVAAGRPRMSQRCATLLEEARQARRERGIEVRELDEIVERLTQRSAEGG